MFARLWRRLKNVVLGHVCDRCGGRPAKLIIDARQTGKKMDGQAGLVTKTYAVAACEFVCDGCRGKT